ncbi:MAG TPA: cytochrome c biogenesis protein CcdA [Roseiflexaceae bacterium]|nr:cytochrome c biogenesis protein CcdA [Roseiflexaceae bacterium]
MPFQENQPEVFNISQRRLLVPSLLIALVMLLALISFFGSRADQGDDIASAQVTNVVVLALPAFLAGLLSFLSPCCLPVLTAYFAYTFQTQPERMVRTTVAFFLGLATTMIVLGASATAVSQLLFRHLPTLTFVGGLIVVGFGFMSVLGRGFSGLQLLKERPAATVAGSYLYGATFALGWTACVGPILGALLMMLATQGIAVLQGAVLAFIYALGLGMPLIGLAIYVSRLDKASRFWRLVRGRGFTMRLGGTTLYLHTTSIASGVLLIVVGVLLATGQLTTLSRGAAQLPLNQWVLGLDGEIKRVFLSR